jgi:hypothetical protein
MTYTIIDFLEEQYIILKENIDPINKEEKFLDAMEKKEEISKLDSRINSI